MTIELKSRRFELLATSWIQGEQPCPDSKVFRIGSSERATGFAANGRQQNDTGGRARRRAYQPYFT
jgi:hypothetical protein